MTDHAAIASSPYRRQQCELEAARSNGFRANTTLVHDSHDRTVSRAITAAKARGMEAIRFLYLRYKDNVYGYVLSTVREPHEAEDVTQQVFMKLMSAIHRYEPRTVPFTA